MWCQINKNKQKDLTSINAGQRQSIETSNLEEPTTSTAILPPFTEETQAASTLSSIQHLSHVIDWTLRFQLYREGM